MLGIFAFVLGAILGSFVNAVSLRLIAKEPYVFARSKCPHCGHVLGPLDMVPLLSFVALRRRCRYCGKPIAWHYFAVELALALVFLAVALKFGATVLAVFVAVELTLLAILFLTDLRAHVLPDEISLPAIALALLGVFYFHHSLTGALIGAAVGGGFFLLQYVLSRGKWIGGGDVRLGFLLGLLLGWPQTVVALFLAYVAGGAVAAVMLSMRRAGWGHHLPFGTFLAIATAVTWFVGPQLLRWYGVSA